jgi:hypothetical protein
VLALGEVAFCWSALLFVDEAEVDAVGLVDLLILIVREDYLRTMLNVIHFLDKRTLMWFPYPNSSIL